MDIRELGPADDPVALLDLSVRAFGPVAQADRPRWHHSASAAVGARQYLGVFDGGQLLAAARYHDMIQWWHGQPVPMAGVASVTVAPEERGRGTGRALMRALLGLIGDRGYPVSALYPATLAAVPVAGLGDRRRPEPPRDPVPLAALAGPPGRHPAPDDPPAQAAPPGPEPTARLRRCGPADATEVLAVIGRVHQALRDSGPNTRDESVMARWLGDDERFAYLAADGFLAYRWQHGNDELLVERALASSPAATRALWGVVASHSSIAHTVRADCGPRRPGAVADRRPGRAPVRPAGLDAAGAGRVCGRGRARLPGRGRADHGPPAGRPGPAGPRRLVDAGRGRQQGRPHPGRAGTGPACQPAPGRAAPGRSPPR